MADKLNTNAVGSRGESRLTRAAIATNHCLASRRELHDAQSAEKTDE